MRLLHTSDWHLGHTLHDVPRDHEHDQFLAWLTRTLEQEAVDALVIAGDVFETANPPASAQARWYGFLADLRRRMPDLDVVVIAGNHDSAARLEAPVPLLRAMRIHVIGSVRCAASRSLDLDRLLVPVHDRQGQVAALLAAVPFLRAADLPRQPSGTTGDPLIEGVRQIYTEVLDAARARRQPGQALLAMGHCYMVGTDVSRLSERRILGGNQHALPVDIFPDDVAYVALGHLHKAQRVGGRDHVRYPGSPLPLAMDEAQNRHQVCLVDLDGERLTCVRTLDIPRAVDFLRIPRHGAAPLAEILTQLAALPSNADGNDDDNNDGNDAHSDATRPYLELCVSLPRPEAQLRHDIDKALQGKRPRLVKVSIEHTGHGEALAESVHGLDLRDLDPRDVFLRRYGRDHEDEPPAELIAAFDDLVDEVTSGQAAQHEGTA